MGQNLYNGKACKACWKKERRIPGCKAEKVGVRDHNGREGHAQVVPNQTVEQSHQHNPVTQGPRGRLSEPEGIPLENQEGS